MVQFSKVNAFRQRKVLVSSKNPQLMSNSPAWYRVHFSKNVDLRDIKAAGINIQPRFFVGRHRYNLFLSPSEAAELVRSGIAKVGLIQDKIFSNGLSYDKADLIHIETSDTFDPSRYSFRIVRHSLSKYSILHGKLAEVAEILSKDPEVLSIYLAKRPEPLNRLGAGYSQQNTRILNAHGDFERVFQNHNLTGSGIVVTTIDTYLDTNSTFFYDPQQEIVNGRYNPQHRKVVYNFWHTDTEIEVGEHGTHTSGTIAGKAICSNCSISAYNGVAPNAKLAFRGWPTDEEAEDFAEILVDIMSMTNSLITSNSWGWDATYADLNNAGDNAMFVNPNKLMLFSAGNSGSFISIITPAEGKNILTIGALSQLQVDNGSWNNLVQHPYIFETLFFKSYYSWAYLLPGSVKPRWISESYYTALYNSRDFNINLSFRFVYANSQEEVQILNAKERSTRPYAVLTNATFECVDISFPVLQVVNADFWEYTTVTGFNASQALALTEQYRPDYGPTDLAYFSSLGPALSGVMKPDLVAPGVNILSARSILSSYPNHDVQEPPDVQVMDGTSMSCPNAAGTAALVQEYVREYFEIDPSSFLLKAILVNAADPIDPRSGIGYPGYNPNLEFGFGQLNLANLPLESEFGFLIRDHVNISDESHIFTSVTVTSTSDRSLRITISYLDVGVADEIPFPLFLELHLFVVSPSQQIYRGNQYDHNDDEHFSTIHRVFIPVNELELGVYEIHVIAHLYEPYIGVYYFGIAVSGNLEPTDLSFTKTTACVDSCGDGRCLASGICDCTSTGYVGENCQTEVFSIAVNGDKSLVIPPHGNGYVSFERNMNRPNDLTVFISLKSGFFIHAFISDGSPLAMPRDYWGIAWAMDEFNLSINSDLFESSVVGVFLHNNAPIDATFSVYSRSKSRPTATSSKVTSSGQLKIIIGVAAALVVVIVVIVAVLLFIKRRQLFGQQEEIRQELMHGRGSRLQGDEVMVPV